MPRVASCIWMWNIMNSSGELNSAAILPWCILVSPLGGTLTWAALGTCAGAALDRNTTAAAAKRIREDFIVGDSVSLRIERVERPLSVARLAADAWPA